MNVSAQVLPPKSQPCDFWVQRNVEPGHTVHECLTRAQYKTEFPASQHPTYSWPFWTLVVVAFALSVVAALLIWNNLRGR